MTWLDRIVRRPVVNWTMTAISAFMIVRYVEVLGDETRVIPAGYVLAAWAVMFVAWLASAIYGSRIRRE